MNIKKHVPNFITCINLFCGCLAIMAAYHSEFTYAATWIVIAAVLDFLDGMFARLLKAYSPLGKELDSLADVVSFGVAPGFIVFSLFSQVSNPAFMEPIADWLPYTAFIIPIFSALRLAKFNIDTRQTTSFIGLPTPANAFFWIGISYATINNTSGVYLNSLSLLALIFIFSYLLISEIPMFALKFKDLTWKNNQLRFSFLLLSVVLLILLQIPGLSAIIGCYIILSIISSKF